MRFIPTRIHGIIDYVVGIALIAAPWIFQFDDALNRAAVWTPIVLGLGTILYSLFTDYELGVMRSIPMRVHLMIDLAAGVILAASPWLFGFADEVYLPHLIVGLAEIGVSLMTRTIPETSRRHDVTTAQA